MSCSNIPSIPSITITEEGELEETSWGTGSQGVAQLMEETQVLEETEVLEESQVLEETPVLEARGGGRERGRTLTWPGLEREERSWDLPQDQGVDWEPSICPRSRNHSGTDGADDPALRKFELELFKFCKLEEEATTASAGVLLREMEKMGIHREDPRLQPIIEGLRKFRRCSIAQGPQGQVFGENAVAMVELDFPQFTQLVHSSSMLISKTFKGQLVIPEFEDFCRNISDIFNKCADNTEGKVASYIPQLARTDPRKWAVSLCTVDGQRHSQGDSEDKFSLQSVSMPFTYALSLANLGSQRVSQFMGEEPSGAGYDEIALDANGQPHNPMINSGAILSASMLLYMVQPELSTSEKFEYVQSYFRRMAGGLPVGFQNTTFLSERESSDRNHALAFFMRENGCFPKVPNTHKGSIDIKTVLDFYFQLCSLEMTTESMSVMAATLANGGICPVTSERVLDSEAVKNVLSLMYSCGMNNYSGQFAFKVGLPAKSGVSGIILVIVPNVMGFATWSPPLDSKGNSARGVMFFKELVKVYRFHMFDNLPPGVTTPCTSDKKKSPTVQNYESRSQRLVQVLIAASSGDRMALERAHLAGLDMNAADYDGRTALHLAACDGHLACVRFLLEVCQVLSEPKDRWGHTPLWDAQMFARKEVVQYMKRQAMSSIPRTSGIKEEPMQ